MQITNQKRIAARLLKCGVNRVWINPSFVDQVASAVQTDDIREFIDEGWIKAKPVKGTSRVRARARIEQKKKGRLDGRALRPWKRTAVGGLRTRVVAFHRCCLLSLLWS